MADAILFLIVGYLFLVATSSYFIGLFGGAKLMSSRKFRKVVVCVALPFALVAILPLYSKDVGIKHRKLLELEPTND